MLKLVLPIASYIWGSVPFGFLIAYWVKGIDIRSFGSGNIGATNVFRVVGRKWGIIVFILDFLKGLIPPFVAAALIPDVSGRLIIIISLLSVCGHNWTLFLKFKGGKGVATSLGVMVSLSLFFQNLGFILLAALITWVITFLIFLYVSLASILAGFIFVLFSLLFSQELDVKIISSVFFIFITLRHKNNIRSLVGKKELRF